MKYTSIIKEQIDSMIISSTIIGGIVGIISWVLLTDLNGFIGFIAFVLITAVSYWIAVNKAARLGMLMEMSINLNEIRCNINGTKSGYFSSASLGSSGSSNTSSVGMLARASQVSPTDKNVWYCKSCGKKNPNSHNVCSDCGKSKY